MKSSRLSEIDCYGAEHQMEELKCFRNSLIFLDQNIDSEDFKMYVTRDIVESDNWYYKIFITCGNYRAKTDGTHLVFYKKDVYKRLCSGRDLIEVSSQMVIKNYTKYSNRIGKHGYIFISLLWRKMAYSI